MAVLSDLAYGEKDSEKIDLYYPDQDGFDVILWFHGGGIENGTRKGTGGLPQSFVKAGFGFFTAEYPLYPDAKYPEFLYSAAKAAAFSLKKARELGGSGRVWISGQSAGAYLTAMLCLDPEFLAAENLTACDFAGFIPDSAQMTTHFNVLRERGLDTALERIDEAAPLYWVTPERRIPPMLVIFYENDMICRPEQNRLFVRAAKRLIPDARIESICLPGVHCEGSVKRGPDGEYPYVTETLKFIRELEKTC